ncbi:hypothetical protein F511_46479 [Dorcoceras hygrometricum]|uniref:Uncharacterized protein n=1 Tax=Dorcoceras hygrometricum TaxID=472368 RepID=A0A2Z6ZTD9_9LAMI|nr:hypothetical protein F511_46479 [Dorcoceras hygrometricum]
MIAHHGRPMYRRCALGGVLHAIFSCYWLRKMLHHGREVAGLNGARCRWSAAFCHGRKRPCGAREFRVAVAGRPPHRRCSGDVVTAGLISSRVWFGPVPDSQ